MAKQKKQAVRKKPKSKAKVKVSPLRAENDEAQRLYATESEKQSEANKPGGARQTHGRRG